MNDALALLGALLNGALLVLGGFSDAAGGLGWLVLYTLAGITIYAAVCWWWPDAPCGVCEGKGRFPSPSGKYSRPCRHCKGGRKLRLGRRVLERWFATSR